MVNETSSTALTDGTISMERRCSCVLPTSYPRKPRDNILVVDAQFRDVRSAKLLNGVCMMSAENTSPEKTCCIDYWHKTVRVFLEIDSS